MGLESANTQAMWISAFFSSQLFATNNSTSYHMGWCPACSESDSFLEKQEKVLGSPVASCRWQLLLSLQKATRQEKLNQTLRGIVSHVNAQKKPLLPKISNTEKPHTSATNSVFITHHFNASSLYGTTHLCGHQKYHPWWHDICVWSTHQWEEWRQAGISCHSFIHWQPWQSGAHQLIRCWLKYTGFWYFYNNVHALRLALKFLQETSFCCFKKKQCQNHGNNLK